MKKIFYVLAAISVLALITTMVFRQLHMHTHTVLLISLLSVLSAVAVMPGFARVKQMTSQQKIFFFTLWICLLLLPIGILFRFLHYDAGRYVANGAMVLLLILLLYVSIYQITDQFRSSPKGKPGSADALAAVGMSVADLDRYAGSYTNKKLPLTIKITIVGGNLVARATNQAPYYLEPVAQHEFKYYQRDIVLKFDTEKDELTLQQRGGFFPFIKDV